jgi:rhomboid protease GluP
VSAPEPPRPIYTPSADDNRIVPAGWLDHAPVTRMLIALNVCVFVAEVALSHNASNLPTRQLLALGASYSLATVAEGRYETLVTACFLHAGLIHLAFNMLALWQAGPLVERGVGSARMAPMYLLAGAFGNLLSVLYGWFSGSGGITVGASGAISGVIAAALVVGWRTAGWRGPLTQAMARWLGFVVLFGVLSNMGGGHIDNSAHIGGALAGAAIAGLWKRGYRYSPAATRGILGGCAGVLVACIAVVVVRDRVDRFAPMDLQERLEFTADAAGDGRCGDAEEGLRAVERLRPAASLRREVEEGCGQMPAR